MKTVEVFFKKTFTMRDEQPDTEAAKAWVRSNGFTYVSHRRITDEAVSSLPFDDLVRYICTGQTTQEIDAHFRSVSAKSPVTDPPKPTDQLFGAGTNQ